MSYSFWISSLRTSRIKGGCSGVVFCTPRIIHVSRHAIDTKRIAGIRSPEHVDFDLNLDMTWTISPDVNLCELDVHRLPSVSYVRIWVEHKNVQVQVHVQVHGPKWLWYDLSL